MDIQIPIVATRFAPDGSVTIDAKGEYRGRSVGAEVTIRGRMKPGLVGSEIDNTAFYAKGLIIRGMGKTTRHLAEVFSEVYITPVTNIEPLRQLDLTSFALDGDPILIETEHLNFKVFHDDQDVLGLYFEMFPHVDIPGGYIRFDEKDEDYRENVVKSFAALSASAAWPILTNRRPSSAQFSWIGIPLCKALSFRRRVKRRQEESAVSHP